MYILKPLNYVLEKNAFHGINYISIKIFFNKCQGQYFKDAWGGQGGSIHRWLRDPLPHLTNPLAWLLIRPPDWTQVSPPPIQHFPNLNPSLDPGQFCGSGYNRWTSHLAWARPLGGHSYLKLGLIHLCYVPKQGRETRVKGDGRIPGSRPWCSSTRAVHTCSEPLELASCQTLERVEQAKPDQGRELRFWKSYLGLSADPWFILLQNNYLGIKCVKTRCTVSMH